MWWILATILFIFSLSWLGKRFLVGPPQANVLPDLNVDPINVPITPELDLHTMNPSEVPELLEAYLEASEAAAFRSVKIIHGRGTGTLRAFVRSCLVKNERVTNIEDAAPPSHWGATIAYLRDPEGSSRS